MVSGHEMWSHNQIVWTKRNKTWLEQHIVISPGTARWYWSDSSIPETSGIWNCRLVFSTEGICEKSKLNWAESLELRYKHCETANCVLWDVCAHTLNLFKWKIDSVMVIFELGNTNWSKTKCIHSYQERNFNNKTEGSLVWSHLNPERGHWVSALSWRRRPVVRRGTDEDEESPSSSGLLTKSVSGGKVKWNLITISMNYRKVEGELVQCF